ncbi:hypothetical protein R1flu_021909 [Riccia fluitans]|uniref:Uncharacterized protein n=1 Tax=Riccia fluitans TaxID=41844 RepID=A0ABD1ZSH2_9MARC
MNVLARTTLFNRHSTQTSDPSGAAEDSNHRALNQPNSGGMTLYLVRPLREMAACIQYTFRSLPVPLFQPRWSLLSFLHPLLFTRFKSVRHTFVTSCLGERLNYMEVIRKKVAKNRNSSSDSRFCARELWPGAIEPPPSSISLSLGVLEPENLHRNGGSLGDNGINNHFLRDRRRTAETEVVDLLLPSADRSKANRVIYLARYAFQAAEERLVIHARAGEAVGLSAVQCCVFPAPQGTTLKFHLLVTRLWIGNRGALM